MTELAPRFVCKMQVQIVDEGDSSLPCFTLCIYDSHHVTDAALHWVEPEGI